MTWSSSYVNELSDSDWSSHAGVWTTCVLGGLDVSMPRPLVSEQAMGGKHYNKDMMANKLTPQALW